MLTIGSLFSGIGGIELGLERTGYFKTIWQIENDEYATKILEKHWHGIRRYGDITKIHRLPKVDLICGGFPCQDISNAGKRKGISGEKSGLWKEFVRIIRMVRPEYVLIENVSALLNRGMDTVLCDLATLGYDAEWQIIPAASVGAPHLRERIFIVAYANDHNDRKQCKKSAEKKAVIAPYANCFGLEKMPIFISAGSKSSQSWKLDIDNLPIEIFGKRYVSIPDINRMDDGISGRMDRIKCLGNAVVPQVAEMIGYMIMEFNKKRIIIARDDELKSNAAGRQQTER